MRRLNNLGAIEKDPGLSDARIELHNFQDDKAKVILDNCRKVIPKDGKLMIVEGVVPTGSTSSGSKNRSVTMLYLVGGLERTEEEW